MQKNVAILIVGLIIFCMAGTVFAADLSYNKTAVKTGTNTATVTIQLNGSSATDQTAADVVFAIDSSGSMSTNDPTDLRKTSTINFINQMNPQNDMVGVVNWDDTIQSQTPALTSNFAQAINVVNQGTPGGTTDMSLALRTSIALLDGDTNTVDKFIILISDGYWNEGNNPLTDPTAVPDAVTKGYTIYTIGLGSSVDVATMQAIATNTGGQYYSAPDATALNDIYNDIFQQITTTATNIVVTDIIPSYMTLTGQPTIAPTSNILNPDGTRTLIWTIPSLGQDQSWKVSYNLISSITGYNIPTNVKANVTYTDPAGDPQSIELPIPTIDIVPANNTTNITTNVTTKVTTTAETVPMQTTGTPLTMIAMGFLVTLGGVVYGKLR